jgi:hypothetical protein
MEQNLSRRKLTCPGEDPDMQTPDQNFRYLDRLQPTEQG